MIPSPLLRSPMTTKQDRLKETYVIHIEGKLKNTKDESNIFRRKWGDTYFQQDGKIGGSWLSLHLWAQWINNYTWRNRLWEKSRNCTLGNWENTPSKQVWKAETYSHQNFTPNTLLCNWEGTPIYQLHLGQQRFDHISVTPVFMAVAKKSLLICLSLGADWVCYVLVQWDYSEQRGSSIQVCKHFLWLFPLP